MFGLRDRRAKERGIGAALIGEGYRRDHVKRLLGGRMNVEAELASDKRVHLLPEVSPEVVVLDCASEGVNPFVALPRLAEIPCRPRIVALVDGQGSDGTEEIEEALISLGADSTADINDPRAVVEAISPDAPRTLRDRRTLAAA